jgi:SAM-dependent methyltransferase
LPKYETRCGHFLRADLADPLGMLADGSFDVVLCALALHYLPDWTRDDPGVWAGVKTGGHLVISIEPPFFEINYFSPRSIFAVEPVKCTCNVFWQAGGSEQLPKAAPGLHHASGQTMIFTSMLCSNPNRWRNSKKMDPKHFKELDEFPAFMCIRAIRKK